MSEVTIIVTAMGFRVPLSPNGTIRGTQLHIGRFASKFEQWEFDRQLNKDILINEYFYFDKVNKVVHFPRFALDEFKTYLSNSFVKTVIIEDPGVEGKEVEFLMLPHISYKNEKQRGAVEYLTDENSGPVRGLGLQTGVGKSLVADAVVLTSGGWVKLSDLTLNHLAVMPDKSLTRVIGIFPQGIRPVYRLKLKTGQSVECCDEHLWKAYQPDWVEYDGLLPDGSDSFRIVDFASIRRLHEQLSGDTLITIPYISEPGWCICRSEIESIEYTGDKETICIMVDHPDHLFITNDFIITHNTVSHIWALQKLGRRSMTTMTSRMEQWVKEMGVYTTLEEDDIYVIQGEASLTKLFTQIDKKIFPKLIIASTKTIRLYLEYGEGYSHLPHPTEFCEKLGIGIIGSDEAHEHFNSNLMMMLAFNPKIFIPITATFVASSPYVKNIFNNMIPKSVQFDGGDYDKFVDVISYQYAGGAHYIKPYHYMRAKGYSQNKFEEYLLSKKGEPTLNALLNDAILPIVKEHYINIAEKGEKFLMICSSKEFCDYLANVFKRVFRDKTVSVFYSGMPVHTLERFDMILSTPGSAGTGRDIKGLRTCFAFENTGSEVRNLQFIGRLRGPPQMMNIPQFVYLYFSCIPQHVNYNNIRAMLYGTRALKLTHRKI